MSQPSYNRIIIDLSALADNYQTLQNLVGPTVDILAIVKSDAYGHGLIHCTKALSLAGASHFGVAELAEGVALRKAGITDEIIIFLGCNDVRSLINHKLTPVVFDIENIRAISTAAVADNTSIGVHLKIDVGMGRLGIMPEDLPDYHAEINRLPGVFLAGIISHFPMADQDAHLTRRQNDKFCQLVTSLANNSIDDSTKPICSHMANSAALIQYPETCHQMVRPGISLYGCYPAENLAGSVTLKPVLSFKTQVLQVKNVPASCGISYGHLFKTTRPSRLAILPVGYADGYLRSLTGKASVLIKGQRAPVCGRICMNACIVDVTDIPTASVGDEVVLLGRQNQAEITAAEVATWMDTINYEVLCLFGNSNTREYM
jgi:alanine racemase